MPVTPNATVPESAKLLELSNEPKAKLFLCFISSIDPVSKLSWCPDVRAALPVIEKAFPAGGLEVALVEVGMRPEYVTSCSWNLQSEDRLRNVLTVLQMETIQQLLPHQLECPQRPDVGPL